MVRSSSWLWIFWDRFLSPRAGPAISLSLATASAKYKWQFPYLIRPPRRSPTIFVDRWLVYYGAPLVILTDNGSNFSSKFFGVITDMLGVKHVYTSVYRPSTNGQVERFNATLADTLVVLTNKTRD